MTINTPKPVTEWGTYINKQLGIKFRYPEKWKINIKDNRIKVQMVNSIYSIYIYSTNKNFQTFKEETEAKDNCVMYPRSKNIGNNKDIKSESSYRECNHQSYGYYYSYHPRYDIGLHNLKVFEDFKLIAEIRKEIDMVKPSFIVV